MADKLGIWQISAERATQKDKII